MRENKVRDMTLISCVPGCKRQFGLQEAELKVPTQHARQKRDGARLRNQITTKAKGTACFYSWTSGEIVVFTNIPGIKRKNTE